MAGIGGFAPNLGIGDFNFVSEMTIMASFSALVVHLSFLKYFFEELFSRKSGKIFKTVGKLNIVITTKEKIIITIKLPSYLKIKKYCTQASLPTSFIQVQV